MNPSIYIELLKLVYLRDKKISETLDITYKDINFKVIITYRNWNYFITIVRIYSDILKAYYVYDGLPVECVFTAHFIERFKERYSDAENWLVFLIREITPAFENEKINSKWIRTRHGKAVILDKDSINKRKIVFLTYVSKFKKYKTLKIPERIYLFGTYGKD